MTEDPRKIELKHLRFNLALSRSMSPPRPPMKSGVVRGFDSWKANVRRLRFF